MDFIIHFQSEKPSDTQHAVHGVQPKVWWMDAGARHVEIARFQAQREIVPDKPVDAGRGLEVELEGARQVGPADAGGTNPGYDISIGNPPAAGREIIAQMRREPDQ